jgi:NAD(P)-dependent dehydrogenase (short-subunit alcohol dehydrogenase family)
MRFEGKTAIVTGGAKGLGRSFATALATEACRVLIADVDQVALEKTAEEIHQMGGGKCIFKRTDVTIKEEVIKMVERALKEFDSIYI